MFIYNDQFRFLKSEESAWKQASAIYTNFVAEENADGPLFPMSDGVARHETNDQLVHLHQYLLLCARRIWPLLPEEGSRMGIIAAESYYKGEIDWAKAYEADWHSEGSAFLFDYGDAADEFVIKNVQAISFANFAFGFLSIRMRAESTQDRFEKYSLFMPRNLFEETVGSVDL